MEVAANLTSSLFGGYSAFSTALPFWAQNFLNLFVLIIFVVIYSVFFWKVYRFVSTKNIFDLNLNQYNTSTNVLITTLTSSLFYFLEYIILLPFLIFFWFAVFTFFLIVLAQNNNLSQILLLSATVVGAIRVTAYIPNYGEKLSAEIAKVLPITFLALTVLNPNSFLEINYITNIINIFSQLTSYLSSIFHYLIFIVILEVLMRFFDFIFSLFGLEEVKIEEDPR